MINTGSICLLVDNQRQCLPLFTSRHIDKPKRYVQPQVVETASRGHPVLSRVRKTNPSPRSKHHDHIQAASMS